MQYKSNVLLVGPAGVGKTKIVEELASQLAGNFPMIPPQLKDYTIWELPLSGIIAGSGLVGDTEKKAKEMIGSVVTTYIYEIMKNGKDFDVVKYARNLKRLK